MFNLGMQELLVILVIVLLLFGAKNLPEIARNLGKSITTFKRGLKETDEEVSTDGATKTAQKTNETARPPDQGA